MSSTDVKAMIEEVEQLLAAAGPLPDQVALAVEKLLNAVEVLAADRQSLADEVKRLRKKLDAKKKNGKTTNKPSDSSPDDRGNQDDTSDHSSEKQRRKRRRKLLKKRQDRRSFKAIPIHETIECPIDPATLPPDAVRVEDEAVIVQGIEIIPKNTKCLRQVFFSAIENKNFRAPLAAGFEQGDFSADLRALIISLKYCGNMSEPKIREFLENFDVQVSAGSLSNILTNTAANFEQEYHDLLVAGLNSTPYQQTDDTSARVKGAFWNTHVLCNPFYSVYSTRPGKDRLTVLKTLQNTNDLQFRFDAQTVALLRDTFSIPRKWVDAINALGELECNETTLRLLLDGWFGSGNQQVRTAIEQAAAIRFYREQQSVPVVKTLVCDDAGQFKLLTEKLALCWIHEGRHYEKLSPLVKVHQEALANFQDRFWDYYASLHAYRTSPTAELASQLRLEFDELFSTETNYEALNDRISKTRAKADELLTVLADPAVPLHNNASELGARVSARRRDVSLHSRSERGVRAMDIFTTLVQTTRKLGISSYAYLRDRISNTYQLPSIADSIQLASG